MTQNFSREWPYILSSLLATIVFLAKLYHGYKKTKSNSGRIRNSKLPPGRRGWPIIGDSISWYNAVASSHPPAFVEQQVERYIIALFTFFLHIYIRTLFVINCISRHIVQSRSASFQGFINFHPMNLINRPIEQ